MAGEGKSAKSSGMKVLREDIRQKQFRRVYLFYGEEEYLTLQYRKELIRAVLGDESSMNLNIHREESLDWNTVQDEILSMPFFAGHRMVVLDDTKLFRAGKSADQDAGSGKGEDGALSAEVAAFLPKIPETTVVLFTERADEKKPGGQKGRSSVDRRGRLFKAVGKCGLAVEFSPPDEQMIEKWVLSRLGAEKIQITREAMDTFLPMTGTDMSHISTETEKLISYAGRGGTVQAQDVRSLTSEILEGRIFRMLDLIAQHDRKGALDLYDDLLRLKEPAARILILLMNRFDQLLLVRSILDSGGSAGRVMEELGMQRWQADRAVRQARGFRGSSLREAVEACADLQERAQSGQIDMRLALELLILRTSRIQGNSD